MKKPLLIIFLIALTSNSLAQNSDWMTVKDLEKGFRVDFPSNPIAQTQTVPSAAGDLQMEMRMLDLSTSANSGILIYLTAYTEYPSDYTDYSDEANIDRMLDGTVNGAVGNVNGELISSDKCEFNNYKCVDSKIAIQSGSYVIHMKSILVENVLYLIQTICSKEDDNHLDDKKFFDSFELIRVK